MVAPFSRTAIPKRSLLQRLLRQPQRVETAEAEINNLFAHARSVRDVTGDDFDQIVERFGFDPRFATAPLLELIFCQYLSHCVSNGHMTDSEVDDLVHLKTLFGLSDARARTIHDNAAGVPYLAAVEERLGDGVLSDNDARFLSHLRDRLLLSRQYAEEIQVDVARALISAAERKAIEDRGLSPNEETELRDLAQNLGTEWPTTASNLALLDRLRLYWAIENNDLDMLTSDLPLRADELVHLVVPRARWREPRRVSSHVDLRRSGDTFANDSLRIFEHDARDPVLLETVSAQVLTLVDVGIVHVTNQRVIFVGRNGERSVELRDLLALNTRDRQLWLKTANGWRTVLEFAEQVDVVHLLLTRLIREASASAEA